MKRTLTAASLALTLSANLLATQATADEALMDGVRPFMCDDEAIVLLETDNGWEISTDPTAKIKPTDNGWRYEDTQSGGVLLIREESRNSWVVDGVSEDGHFTADCIDLADSVSQVVTIIKPRLDEGIVQTQLQLTATASELEVAKALNNQLQSKIENISAAHANEIASAQAVQRTQISYLKMQHKDELSKLAAELEKANEQLIESTEALGGMEGYRMAALLTPEGFDADKVAEMINNSELSAVQKTVLTGAVEVVKENPALLDATLARLKEALGAAINMSDVLVTAETRPDAVLDAPVAASPEAILDALLAPVAIGPPMTGFEREEFRASVNDCWDIDPESQAARVTLTVRFNLDPSGMRLR